MSVALLYWTLCYAANTQILTIYLISILRLLSYIYNEDLKVASYYEVFRIKSYIQSLTK